MVRIYGERVRTTRWWPWGPRSNWRSGENGASSTTTRRNQQPKSSDENRGRYTKGPEGDLAIKEGYYQTNAYGARDSVIGRRDVQKRMWSARDVQLQTDMDGKKVGIHGRGRVEVW